MPKHMMIARQWAGKIGEASYEGNLGIAELVKFSQKASKVQRQAFDSFVNKGDDRKAWALVQKVVGVKLKGKQFESDLKASTGIRWAKNLKVNESMKIKKSEWDKILKEEKRYLTESMAKTKSHEAEELYLYIENTGTLYRQLESIIENIKRKAKKGNYDHKRAPKLWRYLVDNGAKSYAKEHAGGVKDAARIFPGKVRDNVAQVFADEYLDRIKNGEFGTVGNFNEARIIAPAKDKEPVHITDSDLKDHGIKPSDVKRTFLGKNGKGWQIALYQPKKNPRSKYYAIQKYKTDKGSELKTVASQPEAYKLIKGYNAMNESVQLKEASMKSDHHVVVEIKHPELPSSVADGATVVFVGSKRNADKAMKGFRKKNPKRQYIMVYTMSKIKLGQKYVRGKFKESVQLKEALSLGKKDKAVIIAFADEQPAKGKKLSTDGKRLDGDWMGGRGIAEWKNKKVHLNDLGSAASKTVQKMVKRFVPKVIIVESEYYHLPMLEEIGKVWVKSKKTGSVYQVDKGWFKQHSNRYDKPSKDETKDVKQGKKDQKKREKKYDKDEKKRDREYDRDEKKRLKRKHKDGKEERKNDKAHEKHTSKLLKAIPSDADEADVKAYVLAYLKKNKLRVGRELDEDRDERLDRLVQQLIDMKKYNNAPSNRLAEGKVMVKHKKTGNVYLVSKKYAKQHPEMYDKPSKDEKKAGKSKIKGRKKEKKVAQKAQKTQDKVNKADSKERGKKNKEKYGDVWKRTDLMDKGKVAKIDISKLDGNKLPKLSKKVGILPFEASLRYYREYITSSRASEDETIEKYNYTENDANRVEEELEKKLGTKDINWDSIVNIAQRAKTGKEFAERVLKDYNQDEKWEKPSKNESVKLVKEFSAKAHYKKYQDKFRMGGEDLKNFSPIKGMEGPFRFKSGFILYYDPKEGKYYDRRRDVYLSNKEAQIQARV